MTEVKYRGLTLSSHEWVYGDLIQRTHDFIFPSGVYTTEVYDCLIEILPGTKGQCTGLKDKAGTDIYRGDVLGYEDFKKFVVLQGRHIHSPDYYHKTEHVGWYADEIGSKDDCSQSLVYVVEVLEAVVIGNIHENPELLRSDGDE